MTFEIKADRLKTIKVEAKSSVVDSMEYCKEDLSLTVKYKTKGLFKKKIKRYEEVSPGQFFELLNAESIGRALMHLMRESNVSRSY
ncbi:MAG: KTSC domain-containing protein [Cyclobacteriaceae bacterium]